VGYFLSYTDECISLVSPNSTEKPSAHIVPSGGSKCPVRKWIIFGLVSSPSLS